MADTSRRENWTAAREALTSVASRGGSSASAVTAALRRYLRSEQYRDTARPRPSAEQRPPEHD